MDQSQIDTGKVPTALDQDLAIMEMLNQKYPNQGFDYPGTGQLKPSYSSQSNERLHRHFLTWASVQQLAKEGRFEEIRPDILVQCYSNIVEIHRDNKKE